MKLQNLLEIKNVTKQFEDRVVLKGVSFNVKQGEFVTILGPSGCGKTTTLNLINGIEPINSGEIYLNGKLINKTPPHKRPVNTIFQNYALFDHLTVFNNIAYGPRLKKIKHHQYTPEVKKYLKIVGLEGYEDKKIDKLSGGEQQRVAIARALINKPDLLLLDEPMSALDAKLRGEMQKNLKEIQKKIGITFILITHDQDEALTLSDRIIVMNQGILQQVGTPEEIYNTPESTWVANFIGSSNIIDNAVFVCDNLVRFGHQDFVCEDSGFGENETLIDLVIRPEDIKICPLNEGFFNGTVINKLFRGIHWEFIIKTAQYNFLVQTTEELAVNDQVSLSWNQDAIHVMWKEVDE